MNSPHLHTPASLSAPDSESEFPLAVWRRICFHVAPAAASVNASLWLPTPLPRTLPRVSMPIEYEPKLIVFVIVFVAPSHMGQAAVDIIARHDSSLPLFVYLAYSAVRHTPAHAPAHIPAHTPAHALSHTPAPTPLPTFLPTPLPTPLPTFLPTFLPTPLPTVQCKRGSYDGMEHPPSAICMHSRPCACMDRSTPPGDDTELR